MFTATESAAVAVVWAFRVNMLVYRDYQWRELPKMLHRTVRTLSILMILIAFAASFGYIMALMQIPSKITTAFLPLSDNRYVVLVYVNAMLLVLGKLMDMTPLILILTPILLPVITSFGVDPVQFGKIMLVNLGTGLITPPVACCCTSAPPSARSASRARSNKAPLPFCVALFAALLAVTDISAISLWLLNVVL